MKKEITVELEDRSVVVRKLPLRKYADVLRAIETLPQGMKDFDKKSEDELFSDLPKMIADSFPQFLKVIAVATDLTEDEIDDAGLDGATELVMAIIEVNQITKVAKNIKKLLARRREQPQPTGSTAQ